MGLDHTRRALLTAAITAPLLLTTARQASATGAHRALKELEAAYPGRIGVTAINTGTGKTIRYRAHERFALCSTFKCLASAAILRLARTTEPGLMERVIHYTHADLVKHSPVTELHVDTGMTVRALCAATMTTSDNTAGNLLLRLLGGPSGIGNFTRTLGDRWTRLDRYETDLNTNLPGDPRDTSTPDAIARDLHKLVLGDALHPSDRAELTGWLIDNQTGDERIRAGLPKDWTTGDKTGGGDYGALNDIAVTWPPGSAPLVIAVYTTRTDPTTPGENRLLADIARVVAAELHPC